MSQPQVSRSGVINIITGKESLIGNEPTSSPVVRMLAFTGSA